MGKESKQESRQSLTQAFIDRYAPIAMEQQQKYGIPASVTLAQALMESGTGTSRLAQNANNFFGVKCGSGWLAAGKPYMVASDDKPDDKFRVYDDVAQSFEDHSRVLMGSRYMKYCGGLTSVDYENWAKGIKAGGYATSPTYVEGVLKNIKSYNLQEYDQMAVIDARQKGITIGYMRGKDAQAVGSRPSAVIPDTSVQPVSPAGVSTNQLAQDGGTDDIQLSEQQRRNAEAGMSAQPNSLIQMLLGNNMASQLGIDGAHESQGLIHDLISALFKYALTLALTGKLAGGQSGDVAETEQQPCEETSEERAANEKRRESESVTAADIKEQAMLNFDAAYPEQRGQGADRTQQQRYS